MIICNNDDDNVLNYKIILYSQFEFFFKKNQKMEEIIFDVLKLKNIKNLYIAPTKPNNLN